MNLKGFFYACTFIICVLGYASHVNAQATFDIESGLVLTGYNKVRIPGNGGTYFSLNEDFKAKPNAFVRLRAGIAIKSRHTISALYAPLVLNSNGASNQPIYFEGINFAANTMINARYQFNSYRLTYRYDIVKRSKLEFGLGFTAKIRDAEIALQTQTLSSSKKNVGFVPIINFRLNWNISDKMGLLIEGDALVASQGRAEDVLIAGTYRLTDKFMLRLGYRILEGGADGNAVYNFSLFHYASLGMSYSINKKLKSKE